MNKYRIKEITYNSGKKQFIPMYFLNDIWVNLALSCFGYTRKEKEYFDTYDEAMCVLTKFRTKDDYVVKEEIHEIE